MEVELELYYDRRFNSLSGIGVDLIELANALLLRLSTPTSRHSSGVIFEYIRFNSWELYQQKKIVFTYFEQFSNCGSYRLIGMSTWLNILCKTCFYAEDFIYLFILKKKN